MSRWHSYNTIRRISRFKLREEERAEFDFKERKKDKKMGFSRLPPQLGEREEKVGEALLELGVQLPLHL